MTQENPAFVLKKINHVVFEDRPLVKLGPRDVRVNIKQTGICGSDVHYWLEGRIGSFILEDGTDMVLGHESSGVIAEVGSEVGSEVKDLVVGDRVCVEPNEPCRYCDACKDGKYNCCPNIAFAATPPTDGTLAKYYKIAHDFVFKIPDSMDFEQAAMIEPVSVAVQICKRAQVKAVDQLVIFGCGPIGLLCQAVAKAYGCKNVIGVDISDGRLEMAKSFAADAVYKMPFKGKDEDHEAFCLRVSKEMTEKFNLGSGADVILECTGAEPCIQVGVFISKLEARFIQAGMGKPFPAFPATEALIRNINYTGSLRYTVGVYPTAVELVASGKIDVKRLITNRFKFEEAEKAFDLVRQGRIDVVKVMIEGVKD